MFFYNIELEKCGLNSSFWISLLDEYLGSRASRHKEEEGGRRYRSHRGAGLHNTLCFYRPVIRGLRAVPAVL